METPISSTTTKPRSPRAAMLLSDLTYGLGQIYCGRFVRGLVIYGIGMMILAIWIVLIAVMKGHFLQAVLIGLVPAVILWLFARLDARRLAVNAPADYVLKEYNKWYVYAVLAAILLLLAVCGAFFIRETSYEAFYVVTDRMSPTIQAGQRVLVNKSVYDVEPMRRGDVVIIRSLDDRHIKLVQRLVALPGDCILSEGTEMVVNGERISRPGAAAPDTTSQPASRPAGIVVPHGQGCFVGDNVNFGKDKGEFVMRPLVDVIGRVELIYWPKVAGVK